MSEETVNQDLIGVYLDELSQRFLH